MQAGQGSLGSDHSKRFDVLKAMLEQVQRENQEIRAKLERIEHKLFEHDREHHPRPIS